MEWNISKPKLPKPGSTSWPWWSCKCCLAIDRFNWTVMSSLCFLASYPGPCAECSSRGRGIYVHAVPQFEKQPHARTTGSLLAGSASWPFRIMHQIDCHLMEQGQTQIISTSTHSSLATSFRFCAGARAASSRLVPINAHVTWYPFRNIASITQRARILCVG